MLVRILPVPSVTNIKRRIIGSVFSILFHKPFICIGNQGRGMSRFHSLLKMFNLTNRLVDINHLESVHAPPINWDEVDKILEAKRKESMTFLKNALTVNK